MYNMKVGKIEMIVVSFEGYDIESLEDHFNDSIDDGIFKFTKIETKDLDDEKFDDSIFNKTSATPEQLLLAFEQL